MFETTWRFYLRSAEAWDAMYEDCERATNTIDIEQYIFALDPLGERFIEVLRKKNKDGVKVRILCDAVGSYGFLNSTMERRLKGEGIEIKFFNPVKPWRIGTFSSWFLRDHRKLLIVDGEVAHTGGVGLEKRMENWRDTNVRVTGPLVGQTHSVFEQMWAAAPKHKFFRFRPSSEPGAEFSFLTNSPRFKGRYIYHDLRRAIRSAREYAFFTSPYFVPSIKIFRSLTKAARRGVDVRLLLPESSDVHTADIAAGSYFLLALKAGVKIYLYNRGRILHTKTGVIDGKWGTVGSANLDNLSLLLNFEGNIVSTNPGFISELKQQFLKDISGAKLLKKEDWIKRSILRKILEVITWPIHQIL